MPNTNPFFCKSMGHRTAMRSPSSKVSSDSRTIPHRRRRRRKRNERVVTSRNAVLGFPLAALVLAIAIGCWDGVGGNWNFAVQAFGTRPNHGVCHHHGSPATTHHLCSRFHSPIGNSLCRSTSSRPSISSPSTIPSRSTLHASLDDDDESSSNPIQALAQSAKGRFEQAILPSLSVVGWPLFAAVGIPALVSWARSFPANSSEQIAAVTVLIVANRFYLYALGLTIVATTAVRGTAAGDPPALGQRLTALTEELLVFKQPLAVADDPTGTATATAAGTGSNRIVPPPAPAPSFVKQLVDDSGLEENLDGVDAGTQALVLPALVAGLLAISVVALPLWSEGFLAASPEPSLDAAWISQLEEALSKVLPLLGQGWNAILLTLFARAEFRRLGYELFGMGGASDTAESEIAQTVPTAQIVVECLLAVAVTGYGAYYLQYWPAQNFVNSAIAILVARAIRLDSFNAVAAALALLAVYDGASVLLIPAAAHAAEAASAMGAAAGTTLDGTTSLTLAAASTPASSAMGSVAMQKLTSEGFQPGLLVTKLDGDKLTGTLGLGDAVFPSILASFLKRFDEDCNSSLDDTSRDASNIEKSRLFEASLGGYVAGCLACEFAPTIATGGVPALVFIVPLMGLATLLAAARAGRLEELLQYNNDTNEGIESNGN